MYPEVFTDHKTCICISLCTWHAQQSEVYVHYLSYPRLLLGCVSGVCYSVWRQSPTVARMSFHLPKVRVEEAERSGTVTSKGNRGVNSPTVTMKWELRAVAGH